jgi:hypothetical protein
MNHFNIKSLTFYGVAISSVLILFKTVTAYGENNLHPATPVPNHYLLTLKQNLPNCQQTNKLNLDIQQSGIYLNASLLPANNADTEKPLTLTGKLQNQQINLTGKINQALLCQTLNKSNNQQLAITLEMPTTKKDQISGQIKINNIASNLEFTAIPQTVKPETKPH